MPLKHKLLETRMFWGKYLCTFTLPLHLHSGVCYCSFCETVLNELMQYRRCYSLIHKRVLSWTHWTNLQGLKEHCSIYVALIFDQISYICLMPKPWWTQAQHPRSTLLPMTKWSLFAWCSPRCLDVYLERENTLDCRPAPCGFQTRRDFHMTKADQGQKSKDISIYMPLTTVLRENKIKQNKTLHTFVRTLFLLTYTYFYFYL